MSDDASTSTDASRTVAVTGAAGFVGRHIVPALLSRGHNVRVLIRDRAKAARALPCDQLGIVVGDLFDAEARSDLAAGCDAVVHLVGIRRELPGGVTYDRLHVDATTLMVRAAEEAGAFRFVQMSALGARPDAPARYHTSKYEAEMVVRESALAWTIFRPSVIIGPDGEFMQLARGWVRGEESPRRFLPYFTRFGALTPGESATAGPEAAMLQPVDVEDVADAFAEAVTNEDAIGEIYPMGGARALSWPDLLIEIRDATPRAKPKIRPLGIPAPIARAGAIAFKSLGLGTLLPFGPDEPLMATEDNVCTTAKAQAHLGVTPTPFDVSLRRSAAG